MRLSCLSQKTAGQCLGKAEPYSWFLPNDHHDPGVLLDPDSLVWAQPFDEFHDLTVLGGDISMKNRLMVENAVAELSYIVTPLV